jgi:hypothetical protein
LGIGRVWIGAIPSWKAVCSLFTTDQITLERGRSYFLNDFFARRLSQRFGLATRFGSWVKQTDVAQQSALSPFATACA